jgi:hypothetical protein
MKFASLAAVLAASGLVVAACGGGGGGNGPQNANAARDAQVKYSQCMREHGIKAFPDPDSQGRMLIKAGPGTGLDPQSTQFKAAEQACKKYQPKPSGKFDRSNAQKMEAAALKYAQCMRSHGVNFPDPKFTDGGRGMTFGGPGINPNDPNFKTASQACSKVMPGAPTASQAPSGAGQGSVGIGG